MREGPTTIRLGVDLEEQVRRMRRADVPLVVVTRPDGTLVGLLERDQGERMLEPVWTVGHDGR
jgi:hypothetical protein